MRSKGNQTRYNQGQQGQKIVRHAGAIGFLSMVGLTAAMIPLAIYSLFVEAAPQDPLIYLGASIAAGAVVGWVLRK